MCEPGSDFTTRPEATGPFDDSFGYRVTEEGLKALEEYEKRHGTTVVRKVSPSPKTVTADDRQQNRRQRRRQAREQGHRIVTVCGKWRGTARSPTSA